MTTTTAARAIVVLDTSAIVAILKDEPEAAGFIEHAMSFKRRVIAAPTWFETAIVCEGKKASGGEFFDRLAVELRLEVLPFTSEQAAIARQGYKKFGKGRGGKAQLTFGDCFAYALAKTLRAPLLFKDDDFSHTDVTPA